MKQLEQLLGISSREFFSIYHEQKHLLVPSASSSGFNDALELSDIETYLATVPMHHGQVVLVNHNRRPWADQFLKVENDYVTGNVIDIRKLMNLLRNDTTAILGDMSKYIPKLNRYCERLEDELGVKLQANIYITPPKSQGFNVHIDSHDVFVLQLFGKKTWHLYEGMVEYPTKSLIREQKKFSAEEHKLAAQLELRPGDLLYVPQGMYHDASTHDDPSIHITLGLLPRRRSEILKMLSEGVKDHDFFRRPVPGNLKDQSIKEAFFKEFKEACHQLIDEADLSILLEEFSHQFTARQSPDLKGTLSSILSADQLKPDSQLQRKPQIRYWLEEETWFTVVHFYNEKVQVPKPITGVLEVILGKAPFSPAEISSDLGDQVKLDLVKKFVVTGFLSIVKL
ncbi:MAG: hypothetical protein HEP71_12245 [Roseivirga sp.]|nr:hypothetical protein [Roseivirga sp.]